MSDHVLSRRLRAALAGSSAMMLALGLPAPAFAQTQTQPGDQQSVTPPNAPGATPTPQAAPEVADIVVTGSRIARRDYDSDSPLTTVSTEALQNTADVSIDQVLAKLPQAVPGSNQFISATDTQPTPTSSPGIATVNLRGLGANRTLVLVDGRRTQPANASLVVDLNTIPAALVDNVEIITGGAGATYGADAVAGVVNFKLKRNFSGVTVDGQYGQTFRGDGQQYQLSTLMGSNFADGRGNAVIALSYADRSLVMAKDRKFQRRAFTDPGTPATSSFPNFAGATITPSQAAIDAVFGARGAAAGTVRPTDVFYFNPAATTAGSTLFSLGAAGNPARPTFGYTGQINSDYKVLTNGTLASNITQSYLSLPLKRFSMFANGRYEINDNIEFYSKGSFNQQTTYTQLDYSNAFSQWSVTVPYDAAHPVPQELATLLNARGATAAAPWTLNRTLNFMGARGLKTSTYTYEIVAGLRGKLGLGDWTYDGFVAHGHTGQTAYYRSFTDYSAYQALINLPNYGANSDFNNGRTGLLAHCTSGLNPFVTTPVSADCRAILDSKAKVTTDVTQDQVELNVQGRLFALPAGDVRAAFGADYRKNSFRYEPDRGISTNNITSLTIGLFDTSGTKGAVEAREAYGEVLVPLLKDLPFVKELSLNGGFRYSDYNLTGGVKTWKVTGDWAVVNWFKLRGGYQVANRAPNVAELFQPAVFSTVAWPDHDPCSSLTRAAYGNVASNANRAQVLNLCNAIAGTQTAGPGGTPLITAGYIGNQPQYFALGRDLTQGNINLDNEKAKTWTIGGVIRSPFDNPLLRRLSLSVDYYDIRVKDAIAPASTQLVYQECFNGLGNNPTYDPNNQFCKLLIRSNVNGFWIATNAQYQNLGMIHTAGIDAQLDWSIPAPAFAGETGSIFTNVVFNWLNFYKVQNNQGGPIFDYAGSVYAAQGGQLNAPPYGSQFKWKLNATLGYDFGPATISLAWRHLPRTKNNQKVTSPTSTVLGTGKYDIFDLAARANINRTFELRAGIENLFDRAPEAVGVNPGVTNNAGVTDVSYYDVLGRRFYMGATLRF